MKRQRNCLIASEYKECLAFYQWAHINPILAEYLIKNTNEGKRTKKSGYFLKLIGLKAGLPDYHLPVPNDKYHGLWIEMKTLDEENKKKRNNQTEWIEKLNRIGHYAIYAYGWVNASKIVKDYLGNKL